MVETACNGWLVIANTDDREKPNRSETSAGGASVERHSSDAAAPGVVPELGRMCVPTMSTDEPHVGGWSLE